jgi:UDP:flavonoid glycosyltransferase YjiC (YdhE family)
MRITLIPIGSRGDVQPLVSLGCRRKNQLLSDPALRASAVQAGEAVRRERGVDEAAELIERYVATR